MVEFQLPHGSVGLSVVDLATGEPVDSVIIPPVPQPAGAVKDPSFVHGPTMVLLVKMMNFVSKTRNYVSKTRSFAFLND